MRGGSGSSSVRPAGQRMESGHNPNMQSTHTSSLWILYRQSLHMVIIIIYNYVHKHNQLWYYYTLHICVRI